MKDDVHIGYDVFISHSHTDRVWARRLAERVVKVDYNGRPLRPWLDAQFLDSGNLAQAAELTSALDRSRLLVLVLSPASVASEWVSLELEYFLRVRGLTDVIPLLLLPCELPVKLASAPLLDFTRGADFERVFTEFVERVCPPGGPTVADVVSHIDRCWSAASDADPGGFDAEPSQQRDALQGALLRFDIDEGSSEGLALTGFWRAAELLLLDHEHDHPAAYNMTMLMGECLAVAMHRSTLYRQVAQRYLDYGIAGTEDPVMAFVVVRASSKLAEIDPLLLDLGALLRVAVALDARAPLNNKKATIAMLLGRVAGKLRGSDLGDLLITTLSEAGSAARLAAIGAISMAEETAPPVFYLTELAATYARRDVARHSALGEPPSRKLQALLFGIDLDQPPLIEQKLRLAKDDLQRAFVIDDLPYGYSWFALTSQPPPDHPHRAPFIGTVVKATTANMEDLSQHVGPSHVVCLTQPRIPDALFERAAALLIPPDSADFQARRLQGRGVPFAMLGAERMANLNDGDHVEIESGRMRVVSER